MPADDTDNHPPRPSRPPNGPDPSPTNTAILWLIGSLGAACRLAQYAANRSLWLDESFLALNVLQRDYSRLLQPLDYNQGAPVGFLWLTRALVGLLGSSEPVLRLAPLLAGLAALPLFALLLRRVTGGRPALVGFALFALAEPLIYYSAEFKQYSLDALATVLGLWLGARLLDARLPPGRWLLLGLGGAMLAWLSHPAAFTLFAVWSILLLRRLTRREHAAAIAVAAGGLLSAAGLLTLYLLNLRGLQANTVLQQTWRNAFFPLPPRSLPELLWLPRTLLWSFAYLSGRPLTTPAGAVPAAIAAALALWGLGRSLHRNPWQGALLHLPLAAAIAASALHAYPLSGRFLLFALPILLADCSEGLAGLQLLKRPHGRILSALCALALLAPPASLAARHLVQPRLREEIRPLLEYLQDARKPGDALYVYYGATPAFLYYADRYQLPENLLLGRESRRDPSRYLAEIHSLNRHRRIWLLFSHVYTGRGLDEELYITRSLGLIGPRRNTTGASLYLLERP
jgi:hypothetical protein